MADEQFAPHGQFRVLWCDAVLYSELIGTFNEQAIRRYIDEVKALVEGRTERWGRLADMRQWDGGTPAAAALFKEFADWIRTTQCKVSVQLLPDSFRLAIAAGTAQKLNASHLYQVTNATQALQVFTDYGVHTDGLSELLQGAPTP